MTSHQAEFRALAPQPHRVGGVLIPFLSFGKVYLLTELGCDKPRGVKELTIAITIAKTKSYAESLKIWDFWARKPFWAYLLHFRLAMRVKRHFAAILRAWLELWLHSTEYPQISMGERFEMRGLGILYSVRASLVCGGVYSSGEVMDVPFHRVFLDWAFQNGVDVWDEKKTDILAKLKGVKRDER